MPMTCLPLTPVGPGSSEGALSALCLVSLQLLHRKASDWSVRNVGRLGWSYCSLAEP